MIGVEGRIDRTEEDAERVRPVRDVAEEEVEGKEQEDEQPLGACDEAAREEWDWDPDYDLESMTEEMLLSLRRKLSGEEAGG